MVMELSRCNLNRFLSDKCRYTARITGATCVRHRELIIDTERGYTRASRCGLDGVPPMPMGIIHLKKNNSQNAGCQYPNN